MKTRKSRTTGSNLDFDGSHMFGMPSQNTIAWNKLYDRLHVGECIGCGKEKCQCHSRGEGSSWRDDPYVIERFWKKALRSKV